MLEWDKVLTESFREEVMSSRAFVEEAKTKKNYVWLDQQRRVPTMKANSAFGQRAMTSE
jgi:hypothetical protein